MSHSTLKRGYIALISTLVMSFMLTTLAILAGESGLRTVMNTSDLVNHRIAVHAARSCAHIALLSITQDSSFEGQGEELQISADAVCIIEEARESNDTFLIQVRGVAGRSVSRLQVSGTFSEMYTPQINVWQEY